MNTNIYHNSGAVTDLFNRLKSKNINNFSSLDEIFEYKRNYKNEIANIRQKYRNEILGNIEVLNKNNEILLNEYNVEKEEQKKALSLKIENINKKISEPKNNIFHKINRIFAKRKLEYLENNFDNIIEKPLKKYLEKINDNENKIMYLKNNLELEIDKKAKPFVNKIEYIISELNILTPIIYGCVGELKAINLFKKLPNEYYVINDYQERFNPPLFNRNENDKIFSIQLDHIVIGPSGVYLIETKYWNEKSIRSNELFSPIKQVKRGGFALFIIINDLVKSTRLFSNNWGTTKVTVSNILLLMNSTTNEQFQYVKVLTEDNFIDYIIRRPEILKEEQIKFLVNRLK